MLKRIYIFSAIYVLCISFGQAQSQVDTNTIQPNRVEKLTAFQIGWLDNSIGTFDSVVNSIATMANTDLIFTESNEYVIKIVSDLMRLKSDTCFAVILNNLTSNSYIDYSKIVDMQLKNKSYPVLKAILRSNITSINLLKDYVLYSSFLNNKLEEEEIKVLKYLLIDHDPTYKEKVVYDFKDNIRSENIKLIIDSQ